MSKSKMSNLDVKAFEQYVRSLPTSDSVITDTVVIWGCVIRDLLNRYDCVLFPHTWRSFARDILAVSPSVWTDFCKLGLEYVRNAPFVLTGYKACLIAYCREQNIRVPSGFIQVVQALALTPQDEFELANSMNQLFSFPLRLTLNNAIPDRDLVKDYNQRDRQCWMKPKTVEEAHLLRLLKGIIRTWFEDIDVSIDTFVPSHGTGAVAEQQCKSVAEKYTAMGTDVRLRWALSPYLSFLSQELFIGECNRTARIAFVPKSATKKRTICMEPAGLMFWQHAIQRCIDRHLIRKSHVHYHIGSRFLSHDQTQNRELARIGSARYLSERSLCTIDLSNASDDVSYELVKCLFAGTPLWRLLLGTRSTSYTHSCLRGKTYRSYKFAPMGSACCFPVESIIFGSICELSLRLTRGCAGRSTLDWSVYGDDMIVPSDCREEASRLLTLFGFTMNSEKSYSYPSPFRESCGGEYYKGYDITPMRISRGFTGLTCPGVPTASPGWFECLCDMANTSYIKNLPITRKRIIDAFDDIPNQFRPAFTDSTDAGLFSVNPTNEDKYWRIWDGDFSHSFQRDRYRFGRSVSKHTDASATILEAGESYEDSLRLYEWLRINAHRKRVEEASTIHLGRSEDKWAATWS